MAMQRAINQNGEDSYIWIAEKGDGNTYFCPHCKAQVNTRKGMRGFIILRTYQVALVLLVPLVNLKTCRYERELFKHLKNIDRNLKLIWKQSLFQEDELIWLSMKMINHL